MIYLLTMMTNYTRESALRGTYTHGWCSYLYYNITQHFYANMHVLVMKQHKHSVDVDIAPALGKTITCFEVKNTVNLKTR